MTARSAELDTTDADADDVRSVGIRPGVGMLALLASMNYKPWYALSEFVDNSLASFLANRTTLEAATGQSRVTVRIDLDKAAGVIEVSDDAAGIARSDLARALRPAEPPPDRTGLAQYGIGMKSAACWYASHFAVTSSVYGEPVRRRVEFDVPAIVSEGRDQLAVDAVEAQATEHGTLIRLAALNRPMPTGRTLGKIRRYLASIYRSYLRSGILSLTVAGEPLEAGEVEVLRAPRWDGPGGEPLTWRKEVALRLPSGKPITGWLALRARGSTSQSGLALLYRHKVVVGAGAAAGEPEDLYRPPELFGSSNSFVFQRLVGELDVSALAVTHSKDAILWDGEEEQFLSALKEAADAEPLPLLKMARLHRVTERGEDVDSQLNRAMDALADAARLASAPAPAPPTAPRGAEGAGGGDAVARTLRLPVGATPVEVTFRVVVRDGSSLLRLLDEDAAHVVELDREHPFMQSFAHLPHQQIEPIMRIAAALGIAEVEARMSGVRDASAVRLRLNQILRGSFAISTERST